MPRQITGRLFERDRELALIRDAIDRPASGSGSLLVIEGPAGIGKTRLLEAAQAVAVERRMLVLRATGGELEVDFAYGVVRQLLDGPVADMSEAQRSSVLSGAARLAAPLLGHPDGGAIAPRAIAPIDPSPGILHGLYWLVANLAADARVLLLVDDAHWADVPSLKFLVYLARRLDGIPVVIAVAARSDEPGQQRDLAAQLMVTEPARVLRPRALSYSGTRRVVDAVFGKRATPDFVDACHTATKGNPYLLGELLASLRSEGLDGCGTADRVAKLGPATVARSVLLRLGRLPAPAAELSRALAVLGGGADLASAARLAGLDRDDALAAVDALAAAGIVEPGPPLAFAHPIVRTAIHGDLNPAERGLAHARAARLLIEAGAATDRVAPQVLASLPAGDPENVSVLRRAAVNALAKGSPELAIRYLGRAMAEPPPTGERADVLAELGIAEERAGLQDAIEHLDLSIESTRDPIARAERRLVLARALFAAGRREEAVAALDAGISDAGPLDRELALRLEAELSSFALLDVSVARVATDRLERFARLRGDSPAERVLLSALATRAWTRCRPAPEAAELARRSLAGGRLVSEQSGGAPAVYQAIFTLLLADALEDAGEALDQAIGDARARGLVFGFVAASSLRAMLAMRRGDVTEAEAEARVAVDATRPHGVMTPLALAFLIEALLARGEVEAAGTALSDSGFGDDLPETGPFLSLLYRRGLLRFAQGRVEEGLADLTEVGARETRLRMASPVTSRRCIAALAHADAGRRDEAERLVAEHLRLARQWGTPSSIGVGLRAQGLLMGADGLVRLEEAAATLERSPARLDLAETLIDLGVTLWRSGRRADARDPLRRGLDLARRCGGTVLAERAHRELVVAGARPRRLAFSGVGALTASERRISTMAAAGATNREIAQALFVSVRTVENHLAHAYSKLDVHSRRDLPAVLAKNE